MRNSSNSVDESSFSLEVYGFVIWLSAIVVWIVFMAWSYLPPSVLEYIGITYYPDRKWALVFPSWITVFIVYIFFAYQMLNWSHTHPPGSRYNFSDGFSRAPGPSDIRDVLLVHETSQRDIASLDAYYATHADNRPIPEAFDIDIRTVNKAMFGL